MDAAAAVEEEATVVVVVADLIEELLAVGEGVAVEAMIEAAAADMIEVGRQVVDIKTAVDRRVVTGGEDNLKLFCSCSSLTLPRPRTW